MFVITVASREANCWWFYFGFKLRVLVGPSEVLG